MQHDRSNEMVAASAPLETQNGLEWQSALPHYARKWAAWLRNRAKMRRLGRRLPRLPDEPTKQGHSRVGYQRAHWTWFSSRFPESVAGEIGEAMRLMGKAVVTLTWNGEGPAHSGSAAIYAQPTGFLVDTDEETYGLFETLDDALAVDTFHFGGTPCPMLTCSPEVAASFALLAAALDLAGGEGGSVRINGVDHVRTTDGLTRRT